MKHQYKGEELPLIYHSNLSQFFIKLDSYNKIFKIQFASTNTNYNTLYESFCSHLQDKSIDEINTLLKIFRDNQFSEYENDMVALELHRAFISLLEKKPEVFDTNDIICRCNSLRVEDIEALVIRHQGDDAEIRKNSHVAMICGGCEDEYQFYFKELSYKHDMFGGFTFAETYKKIGDKLEEFSLYSPSEFSGAQIGIRALSFPTVYLTISQAGSSLTIDLAQKSLRNFLAKELELPIEVEVQFSSDN